MNYKIYELTQEGKDLLNKLLDELKADKKYLFMVHTAILAKTERTYTRKLLKYGIFNDDEWNHREEYMSGNYDDLIMTAISLYSPLLYKELRAVIPPAYIEKFLEENIYPFKL